MRYSDQLLEAVPAVFAHFLEQLQAELTSSTGTVPDEGSRAVEIRSGSTGTLRPTSSAGALMGFSVAEKAGAVAQLVLRDGSSHDDEPLVYINLQPNESTRDWYGEEGVGFGRGVYVDIVSGAVEGAVYLRGVS